MGGFPDRDHEQLRERGISEEELKRQLDCFRRGFRCVPLVRPATLGDGIESIEETAVEALLARWKQAADASRLSRFVPASGAASRMFQLLERARSGEETASPELDQFFDSLSNFAFASLLEADATDRAAILETLLSDDGLGFARIPKGLVPFHGHGDDARTAFEEHLREAAEVVADSEGRCRVHFTVTPAFQERIDACLAAAAQRREDRSYDIGYSEQSPSTDTVAATLDGDVFRDEDGALLFRPGGHGSLIKNLDELSADIVLIKNIDNVAVGSHREAAAEWDRRLIGLLLQRQEMAFRWFEHLTEPADAVTLTEVARFVRAGLHRGIPQQVLDAELCERQEWFRRVLAKPLRVCGMVRNEGEPGGGPFWVSEAGGGESLQIVESSQIDHGDAAQESVFQGSTHFNPVQLICGLRGPDGNSLPLKTFVDPETSFIATKSAGGVSLQALERPGLWNGAMAFWNTVFIEVPIETFNPVKTVLDLLRSAHQG